MKIKSIFHEDGEETFIFPILPEQFFSSEKRLRFRGERALMHAVLKDAIECFQRRNGRRALRLANDAEEWLFSDESRLPFSFVNICNALELEPEYIRRELKRIAAKKEVQNAA